VFLQPRCHFGLNCLGEQLLGTLPQHLAQQVTLGGWNPNRRCDSLRHGDVLLEEKGLSTTFLSKHAPSFNSCPSTTFDNSSWREMSGIVNKLFKRYELEGIAMPYTMEDFRREYLAELSPEERLKGLSPDERLEGLSLEDRLRGLSPEEIKAYLKKREQLKKSKRRPTTKRRNPDRRGKE
jgi:hypothetical protein